MHNSRLTLFKVTLFAVASVILAGCATTGGGASKSVTTHMSPGERHVRVSLQNRAVYVYNENNEPLFVSAVAIGTPENPTPIGNFEAFNKIERKRSGTYGFHVRGDDIRPGKRSNMPYGKGYVGYPMPYWVEFKSGYGFHAGAVWPTPRSHGCLRIHKTLAKEFFELVDEGTPIYIANSLPEDSTKMARQIWRPTDYAAPNSPGPVLISNAPFTSHNVTY